MTCLAGAAVVSSHHPRTVSSNKTARFASIPFPSLGILQAISKGYIVKSGMKQSVLQATRDYASKEVRVWLTTHRVTFALFPHQEKAVHMQCDSLFIVRLFEPLVSSIGRRFGT